MAQPTTEFPMQDAEHIVKRPDGYYWIDPDTGVEFGPFATRELALADMQSMGESLEPGTTLQAVEAELGIADWIDAETGEPAEDNVPHLEDDS